MLYAVDQFYCLCVCVCVEEAPRDQARGLGAALDLLVSSRAASRLSSPNNMILTESVYAIGLLHSITPCVRVCVSVCVCMCLYLLVTCF